MLPGIPVHVVQRGNNRQDCFYKPADREFYLFHLARLTARNRCAIHAYCLMTNHVHLLLTAATTDGCGRLMKDIGQLHTQYMNRAYGRSGSLWEGRFRSCLVQAEEYLFACYRYIELNPVRARLVEGPAEYPWSSHAANAEGQGSEFVVPHEEYARLGRTSQERQSGYRGLFETEIPGRVIKEIRDATNGNFVLGDKAFRHRISAQIGRRAERGLPGRPALGKRGLSLI